MKKAIYTVNLSGYDHGPTPPRTKGWDKILFTDEMPRNVRGWDKIHIVQTGSNPAIEARRYKWLSHVHLNGYDLVCYFDANMNVIRTPPNQSFRIRHFKRDNVRQECDALNRQLHRCSVESVENQWQSYLDSGFDDSKELWLNGFFVRDHSAIENRLCEKVWEIINKFTPRDQLALPYAMWELVYNQENRADKRTFFNHVRMKDHRNLKPELYK